MSNYKVSIGIPVYNASKYIERCARSIFEQSYDNLQIVFVDDFSTDNSVEIINQVLQDYPQRKSQTSIIKQERNKGVSEARNILLHSFQGEFFTFVDADDNLMPNAIFRLVKEQQSNDYDLVTGNIVVDYGDHRDTIIAPQFDTPEHMLLHLVSQSANHSPWARLYRRSIAEGYKIEFVPEIKMGEDWLFLVKYVLNVNKVSSIDDFIYVYNYMNEESATHTIKYHKCMLADVVVLYKIRELVKSKGVDYVNGVERQMSDRIESGLLSSYYQDDEKTFNKITYYIRFLNKKNIDNNHLFKKLCIGNFLSKKFYTLYFLYKKIASKS